MSGCMYHYMFIKRDGEIVCTECGTNIRDVPRFRDIGSAHFISPTMHASSCRKVGVGGLCILHSRGEGEDCCEGALSTCSECGRNAWTLDASGGPEFVTLTPSVLCGCGDHGFVTNGRWVPA